MAKIVIKNTALCIAVAISVGLFVTGTVSLLVLLGADVITIPYLTPFAHFLVITGTPFVPLFAPITLGAFLKVCQHKKFPGQRLWMFITASWVYQSGQRVWGNVMSLYLGRADDGGVMFCQLDECHAAWIEEALLLIVIVGQIRGWKWDVGYVDMWVDGLVKAGLQQQEAKRMKEEERRMEEGTSEVDRPTTEAQSDQGEKVALLVYVEDVESSGGEKEEVLVVEDEENGHGKMWRLWNPKKWKISGLSIARK
jgi:hypothetical protein